MTIVFINTHTNVMHVGSAQMCTLKTISDGFWAVLQLKFPNSIFQLNNVTLLLYLYAAVYYYTS